MIVARTLRGCQFLPPAAGNALCGVPRTALYRVFAATRNATEGVPYSIHKKATASECLDDMRQTVFNSHQITTQTNTTGTNTGQNGNDSWPIQAKNAIPSPDGVSTFQR